MKKAYLVRSSMEDYAEIIFAETPGKSKTQSSYDDDFIDISAKRVPQFDSYRELGYVPKNILIEDGWWFTCDDCSEQVTDEDDYGYDPTHDLIYCSDCRTPVNNKEAIKLLEDEW